MYKENSRPATAFAATRLGRLILSVAVVLCVVVGGGAVLSGIGASRLPHDLEVLRLRLPVTFPVHMIAGGLGLIAALAAIGACHRCSLHRPLGYTAGVLLITASLAALPSALASLASPWARVGFAAQGLTCLVCLAAGWRAIRQGQVALHRRLMGCAAATAFGAVLLRILLLAVDCLGLPFEASYAIAAWLAWLIPVALVATRARVC